MKSTFNGYSGVSFAMPLWGQKPQDVFILNSWVHSMKTMKIHMQGTVLRHTFWETQSYVRQGPHSCRSYNILILFCKVEDKFVPWIILGYSTVFANASAYNLIVFFWLDKRSKLLKPARIWLEYNCYFIFVDKISYSYSSLLSFIHTLKLLVKRSLNLLCT